MKSTMANISKFDDRTALWQLTNAKLVQGISLELLQSKHRHRFLAIPGGWNKRFFLGVEIEKQVAEYTKLLLSEEGDEYKLGY
ncbi:MAG: hypothetical protein ACQEQG_10355 [Bacillota bacterium]